VATRRTRRRAPSKPVTPEVAPAPVAPPEPELPRVKLVVFTQNSGVHPVRMAGFIRKMKGIKPERRTMVEWRQTYEAFLRAPIVG